MKIRARRPVHIDSTVLLCGIGQALTVNQARCAKVLAERVASKRETSVSMLLGRVERDPTGALPTGRATDHRRPKPERGTGDYVRNGNTGCRWPRKLRAGIDSLSESERNRLFRTRVRKSARPAGKGARSTCAVHGLVNGRIFPGWRAPFARAGGPNSESPNGVVVPAHCWPGPRRRTVYGNPE